MNKYGFGLISNNINTLFELYCSYNNSYNLIYQNMTTLKYYSQVGINEGKQDQINI